MSYPGGKNGAGVYQTIINHIPPHQVYIEPFLGSGAVMRMKTPAAATIGVDIDPAAIANFRRSHSPNNTLCELFSPSTPPPGHPSTARALTLIHGDALDFLSKYPWTGAEFVYCDPPYLMDVRSSKRNIYRHEFSSPEQHGQLLSLLKRIQAAVMISGYASTLYEQMLPDWSTITFCAVTRAGYVATERLWMNYPIPTVLHDYRYLGRDFRERERIHRRQARWKRRLLMMDPLERAALLSAIRNLDISSPNKPDAARALPPEGTPLVRILSPYTTIPPGTPGSNIDRSTESRRTVAPNPTIDAPGHTTTSDDR